uniref:Uncharacterized protein n=1 Tax=Oncorhynchus kisutch TaxID=8019 RepID=A0A8C7H2V8_ONCKI
MNTLQAVSLVTLGLSATNLNNRALWQFRDMITCTMPDSWPILDYTDYRCYCGKSGVKGQGTRVGNMAIGLKPFQSTHILSQPLMNLC